MNDDEDGWNFAINPATVAVLILMGSVYLGQLYLAGSTTSEAAFTVIPELPTPMYVMLSPWLHSSHIHILENTLAFALLGGWTERQVGSTQFTFGILAAGYLTNLVPALVGFGGFGVGASGITNTLWGLFTLTQIYLYHRIVQMDPINYWRALYRLSLFTFGLLFVLQSTGEFMGYLTPPPGSATGVHLLGVVLGLVWFLYRRASLSVQGWILQQQV